VRNLASGIVRSSEKRPPHILSDTRTRYTACGTGGTSGAIARAWAFEFERDGGISAVQRPKYQGRCRYSECEIIVPAIMSNRTIEFKITPLSADEGIESFMKMALTRANSSQLISKTANDGHDLNSKRSSFDERE
jgi:hypothetical protein